jgi:hypothetical protein
MSLTLIRFVASAEAWASCAAAAQILALGLVSAVAAQAVYRRRTRQNGLFRRLKRGNALVSR